MHTLASPWHALVPRWLASARVTPYALTAAPLAKPVLQGDTVCARGTPYAFYFRRGAGTIGAGSKLVVEFEGGGACWNARTCGIAGGTFKETVEDTRAAFARQSKVRARVLCRARAAPWLCALVGVLPA